MTTWNSEDPIFEEKISPFGWLLVLLRGFVLGTIVFGCLGILLLVRLIERPLCGLNRPVTPYITQFVCKAAFLVLQMPIRVEGKPMSHMGAAVANHSSWLDIFSLNASQRVYFISKAEVAKWPGIGWLARATGTVFINRKKAEAKLHQTMLEDRLNAGHRLMFFPEGTSTDGLQVIPFKSTLFAAFLTPELKNDVWIQPVTLIYTAPNGRDPKFYGWWGDMEFGHHLLKTLAAPKQGAVRIVYHAPVQVSDFSDRKSLAANLQATVADALVQPAMLD